MKPVLCFAVLFFIMKALLFKLLLVGFAIFIHNSRAGDNDQQSFDFPDDFKFGAASAAYQIEGAWDEDGKSPSIWDTFTHNHPELIHNGSTGDVSADSYHLHMKDIDALKRIGVKKIELFSNRFSHKFFTFSSIITDSRFRGRESSQTERC